MAATADTAPLASLGLLLSALADSRQGVSRMTLALPEHETPVPRRPELTPQQLLLPANADWSGMQHMQQALLYRASVAHAAAHLRYSRPAQPVQGLKPMAVAVISALEDARVEQLLVRDFPGTQRWFADCPQAQDNPHGLDFSALIARLDRLLMTPCLGDDNFWVNKARSLFGSVADLSDEASFRQIAALLANDLGQMRVPFDPRHYLVPAPWRDDHSYLWQHAETATAAMAAAGQDTPPPARPSLAHGLDTEAATVPHIVLHRYPEWDERRAIMRTDWCTVIEQACPVPASRAGVAEAPGAEQRWLARQLPSVHARVLRKQREGDDTDLDAAIAALLDHRSRLPPDPRIFTRSPRKPRAVNILVLLDLSQSANDAASGAAPMDGRASPSVLELGKRAAVLLARAVGPQGLHRLAIHGFCSNTRAEVHYQRLLDFVERPGRAALARVQSATARYSTRMGAALRHATGHLLRERGAQRLLLLVTDGAPSDIDVFDPAHLVHDARAAVEVARAAGIQVGCASLGRNADADLRTIFGARGYCTVADPLALPRQLARLCVRHIA